MPKAEAKPVKRHKRTCSLDTDHCGQCRHIPTYGTKPEPQKEEQERPLVLTRGQLRYIIALFSISAGGHEEDCPCNPCSIRRKIGWSGEHAYRLGVAPGGKGKRCP